MEREKEPLQTPTSSELDCLAVLWEAHDNGVSALRLSEIHQRLADRREQLGEGRPAPTTVSTYLRSLVAKQLLNEVTAVGSGPSEAGPRIRTRGMLTPKTRSPHNAYQATHKPGQVLAQTYSALAACYPRRRRLESLIDFARALQLPDKIVKRIDEALGEVP